MTKECDVLVVGAGPAGVSAAYFLKHYDTENKLNVELVDRLSGEKYAIYHDMCGEAVSKKLFEELDPLKPEGIVEEVKLVREHWPGNIDINTPMAGYLIDRGVFLKSIIKEFKRLGGVFINKRVGGVKQGSDKVDISFEDGSKLYDYVVAADGANSLIRNVLGIRGGVRSFTQYIVDKEPERGVLDFFYDEEYCGDYKWVFPHEGKTKMGFPVLKGKTFKPEGKVLDKQARAIGFGGVDRYVTGRVLLVGDAACQTNALTKGGIRPGMIAGKIAAKAVVARKPENYEKEWIKTAFASKSFTNSFKRLSSMSNIELEKHIKPFRKNSKYIDSKYRLYLKLVVYYPKYLSIYRAYNLANKFGW